MTSARDNARRTLSAERALQVFQLATSTDAEDALSDLLCNLAHYCDVNGQDFPAALAKAGLHYEAETDTPRTGHQFNGVVIRR